MKAGLLSVLVCLMHLTCLAQVTVRDADTRVPVPGAAIYAGSETGVAGVTNADGVLTDISDYTRVRVEALGYFSYTGTVPQGGVLEVYLLPKTQDLGAAVITGQSAETTLDQAVHRMQVIDMKQARAIGALTVRDALELQPNLNIVQDAALGSQVQLLGLGGQNVKVLVNGVPVIGRLDGNIDLDQLALVGIERIEVVEGPMGVEYGTDALAGTINIITKAPLNILTAELRAQATTMGRSEVTGEVSVPLGQLQSRWVVRRNFFEGLAGETPRVDLWKPKEQRTARVELTKPLTHGRIGVDAEYFYERLWSDGAIQYQQIEVPLTDSTAGIYSTPFAFDQTFDTERLSARAFVNTQLGQRWTMDGFVSANHYERKRLNRRKDLVSLEGQLTTGAEDHDTTAFVNWASRTTWSRKGTHTYTVGYDVNHEVADGKRFTGVDDAYTNLAAFALAELNWGGLTARPGLRVQYHSVYQAPLIPSLNVRYQQGDWVYRASYGRGFRAPGLKELYFFFVDSNHNIQGNQNLLAETSHAVQASAVRKCAGEQFYWNAEVHVFYNDIDDLIALALVDAETQLYSYVNVAAQTNYGAQGRLTWGWPRLKLDASVTHLWRSSVIDPEDRGLDQPALQAAAGVRYTFAQLGLVVASRYRYTGLARNYVIRDEVLLENETEAFGLLSVSASRAFWQDRISVQVGANNLLNVVNVNQSIPASGGIHAGGTGALPVSTGRNFYLQFAWQFQQAN